MNIEAGGTFAIGGSLRVHRMGYGAMRLTAAYAQGRSDHSKAPGRVLRRAVELGIDFIDTADSYGPHINEEQIAEVLAPYPTNMVIATKFGTIRTPGDPQRRDYDNSPAYVKKAVEGSLRRLKLDHLPLYQIHRLDGRTPLAESLGALARLRDEGKIGHVGLSEVDLPTLIEAHSILPIATVQNLFNLWDRQHDDVLAWCEANGVGFIPWFPIGGGRRQAADDATVAAIAKSRGVTPTQVALAWLLLRSPTMLLIPGTASVPHLEENVAACNIALDTEEMVRLNEIS